MTISQIQLLQPILYVLLVCCLTSDTENTLQYFPKLIQTNFTNTLPTIPINNSIIWKLSDIYRANDTDMLDKASNLLNFKFDNIDQLDILVKSIQSDSPSNNILTKIWNFMSFVNLLWLTSIVVMCEMFFSCMKVLLSPFIKFMGFFKAFILKHLISITYFVLGLLLSQAFYIPASIGQYIAITSISGYASIMYYTFNGDSEIKFYHSDKKYLVRNILILLPLAMLSVHFNSPLMGFFTIVQLYSIIGFSFFTNGMYYIIGFSEEDGLFRCVITSLFVIPVYIHANYILKNTTNVKYIEPFYYGIYVFGIIVYLLALLIASSRFYDDLVTYYKNKKYWTTQIWMVMSLITLLYVSSMIIFNNSIYNVTVTFGVLYIIEKICEFPIWDGAASVLIFMLACLTYYIALWLNLHPEFIKSILTEV